MSLRRSSESIHFPQDYISSFQFSDLQWVDRLLAASAASPRDYNFAQMPQPSLPVAFSHRHWKIVAPESACRKINQKLPRK
jgi:hypothetical protein